MYPAWVHSKGGGGVAKEKFDLTKLLGNRKPQNSIVHTGKAAQPNAVEAGTVFISIHKLEPSAENFYSVEDVADLKDSIELFGVKQNLLIEPIPGKDGYKIIAGHRRREASRLLVEEGKTQYEFVPCEIETDITPTEREILLIMTNSTAREITPYEKVRQVSRLKELFTEYKKEHKLPGRIQKLIADVMNISKSQVERMETIDKKLSDDFKEELKSNNISFSTASELSRLSATDQQAAYEKHKETGTTSLREVQEIREEKKDAQEGNPKITALRLAKAVLCKESERTKLPGVADFTVVQEYRIIMNKKVREVEKELQNLIGQDIFKLEEGAGQ